MTKRDVAKTRELLRQMLADLAAEQDPAAVDEGAFLYLLDLRRRAAGDRS